MSGNNDNNNDNNYAKKKDSKPVKEQEKEYVLPYLKTLVVHNNSRNKPEIMINGKEEYPCDISQVTRILAALVQSKNYFDKKDTADIVDRAIQMDIASLVYESCNQYRLKPDTMEHVAHLVGEIYPMIKESILSSAKANGMEQEQQEEEYDGEEPALQPLKLLKKGRLYTNKQISTILSLTNEMLREIIDWHEFEKKELMKNSNNVTLLLTILIIIANEMLYSTVYTNLLVFPIKIAQLWSLVAEMLKKYLPLI